MNTIEARAILAKLSYRDWKSELGYYNNGAFWLQWVREQDGAYERSQRWYVSNTATRNELVEIAWQAMRTVELRKVQQSFLYRGQPIFSGCDIDALSELHSRLRESEANLPQEEKHG